MLDRRHAPLGRTRPPRANARRQGLPQVSRGRARRGAHDIFDQDHGEPRRGGFRWLLSTCLAAAVGAIAIGVVLFGSLDRLETNDGVLPTLRRLRETRLEPAPPLPRAADGLNWTVPKSDRLISTAGAMAARQIIHDQVQVRRDNRPFIEKRQYMRIFARLSDAPQVDPNIVPPFNPFKLYATEANDGSDPEGSLSAEGRRDVVIQVVELVGGILPAEDGQELETQEIVDLVARAQEAELEALRPEQQSDPSDATPVAANGQGVTAPSETNAPNTTVLSKSVAEFDDADDIERTEVRTVKIARGDTLTRILQRFGADPYQTREMIESARSVFPESALAPGQEVQVTLVPSLAKPDKMEPAKFTVLSDSQEHKVTVYRNAAGEFVATTTTQERKVARAALGDSDQVQSASLYSGLYAAALSQGVPSDTITQILRVHAYETDFRRRIRNGDMVDFFFDTKDEGGEATPGELLYTSITAGNELQRYWRFRTPDGIVDYYDETGNNSKKFLMRRPVRGEDVRLASGFGMRWHPILNISRMHTGVDWAAPIGTPILASGNGVIEEAGRKGQNGNYVRIRHANGYQTTYSHMQRFAPGIVEGAKIKQGQVIGFIGMTGLTNGPHLHFEVLINNRWVDPLQIQVPRERRLTGKALAEFQKERARIDELMRRAPVVTASASRS